MNKHIMYFNISDIKAKGYLKNWQIVIICTCEKTGQIETHTHTHRKMMHHSSNTHNRSIETELFVLVWTLASVSEDKIGWAGVCLRGSPVWGREVRVLQFPSLGCRWQPAGKHYFHRWDTSPCLETVN